MHVCTYIYINIQVIGKGSMELQMNYWYLVEFVSLNLQDMNTDKIIIT